MPRRLSAILLYLALLPGCGEQRLDATSDASEKASVEKMTSGMTDAEKKAFVSDCAVLAMGDMMKAALVAKGNGENPPAAASAMHSLDGMTRSEIHARAEARRAEIKAKMPAEK